MTAMQLVKNGAGLFPAYKADAERIEKIKLGSLLLADVKQPRNPMFHRKFFALLNLAYEYWNPGPVTYRGKQIEVPRDFERFRKDVLIMAGFRRPVVNIKGELRLEPDSISFASMDEERFQECYGAVFNVLWDMILSRVDGMTQEEVDRLVDQMLSYE
jgi:hypothetical protein